MYLFAVMGKPIAHSLSPDIHHTFARHLEISVYYKKILSTERAFAKMVTNFINNGGHGINITLPFKQQAYILCGENVTERARIAQAVNTLYIHNNALFGDNTDGSGLVKDLSSLGWNLRGANIALIGAGGAARGAIYPLSQAGVSSITVANRSIDKAVSLVSDLSNYTGQMGLSAVSLSQLTGHYDLVINASSSSLSSEPLELAASLTADCAYDMSYHPRAEPTAFMQQFAALNANTSDGFGMLLQQAADSFEIWTGTRPNISQMDFGFLRE